MVKSEYKDNPPGTRASFREKCQVRHKEQCGKSVSTLTYTADSGKKSCKSLSFSIGWCFILGLGIHSVLQRKRIQDKVETVGIRWQ